MSASALTPNKASFEQRRGEIELYFDRTAAAAWARLTSTAPLGRIRASVRAGRDAMRATLLAFLPTALDHATVLDAGGGTGALAIALARRGAQVTAVDLSPTLIELARTRLPANLADDLAGSVRFQVGDMTDPAWGRFDHIVAMDSLIHYDQADVLAVLANFAARARRSIVFTYAPATPLLTLMHRAGRLFPRGNRSPAIQPLSPARLHRAIAVHPGLGQYKIGRTRRIAHGFYTSQALELVRQ